MPLVFFDTPLKHQRAQSIKYYYGHKIKNQGIIEEKKEK